MKGNDISNKSAPIIVFDLDSLLFKETKLNTGILGAFSRFLSTNKSNYDFFNREVNKNFVFICNSIWTNYNFTIYLETTFPIDDSPTLADFLNENIILYYSRLIQFKSMKDLRMMCELEYYLYVSNDTQKLAEIGKPNALSMSEIPNYITRLGRKQK